MKIFRNVLSRWKTRTHSITRLLVDNWEINSTKSLKIVENKKKKLAILKAEVSQTIAEIEEELFRLQTLNEQAQTTIEALRNENEILADIVVPNLTAACKLGLERWNAEIAVQARKQVTSSTFVEKV